MNRQEVSSTDTALQRASREQKDAVSRSRSAEHRFTEGAQRRADRRLRAERVESRHCMSSLPGNSASDAPLIRLGPHRRQRFHLLIKADLASAQRERQLGLEERLGDLAPT